MSHFLNFRATNDVIISVNGLVVQSPFGIKNNDVITIKAKTNVTLNINGTSYSSAQTIALSETNITVTYSTTGDEQSTYYILTINYSDEVLSGLKGFLKNKDNKVLFPYAYGLKNPDGSDRPLGGVGVDLTYATFDEDGNFAITPQQLAVLNADANNYITLKTYVYRSVVDPKQGDMMYYVSTLANINEDGSFVFLTITINKNTLMAKYGYSVINLNEIGGNYISITADSGVTSGNITQSQLELLQKSVNNNIFLNEEKYYLMDKETTENYLVYGCVVKDNANTTWVKTITISKTNLGWSLTTLSLIGKTDFDNALLKTKQATKTTEMTEEVGIDANGKLWVKAGGDGGFDKDPEIYNITTTITNGSSSGASTILENSTATVTLTASTGYERPDTITVSGATYTYTKATGVVALSNPTGNVTISAVCKSARTTVNIIASWTHGGTKPIPAEYKLTKKNGQTTEVFASDTTGCFDTPQSIEYADIQKLEVMVSGDPTEATIEIIGEINKSWSGNTPVDTWVDITQYVRAGSDVYLNSAWCFAAGTQITLADRTTKAIEDITYDDELLVWSFYEGKFDTAKPYWIMKEQQTNKYLKVTFSDGTEFKTVGPGLPKGYHRMFNKEAGEFTHLGTDATPIGTTTFKDDNTFPTLVSQEVIYENVKYYNIITDKHFNIFANGILTSCRLSNKYHIENMKYVGEPKDLDEENYYKHLESLRK